MIIEQMLTHPEVWAGLAVIGTIVASMSIALRVVLHKIAQPALDQ